MAEIVLECARHNQCHELLALRENELSVTSAQKLKGMTFDAPGNTFQARRGAGGWRGGGQNVPSSKS